MNFLFTALGVLVWIVVFVAILVLTIGLFFLYLFYKYGKEALKDMVRKAVKNGEDNE
jgi:mannose/fructose/N-acetylgalactosamine-specific phosphotransferase system component IID